MKKSISILLLSALLLTACDTTEENSSDINNSLTFSDNENSNTESQEGFHALIDEFEIQTFTDPTGETVSMHDAVDSYFIDDNILVLKFDFGVIRYARPYYYETTFNGDYMENINKIDSEQDPIIDALPELEWFRVKAGDKLDCGLTVKNAEYNIAPEYLNKGYSDWMIKQRIDFDGELTLEGYLRIQKNDSYFLKEGDLYFCPDVSDISGIPALSMFFLKKDNVFAISFESENGYKYIASDIGNEWYLGNINEDKEFDTSIFSGKEFVKVKVTLNNIYALCEGDLFARIFADIKEIETV